MPITRNLMNGQRELVPESVRRTIEEMEQRLSRTEQMVAALKSNPNGSGLTSAQVRDVVGLIGARSQAVIGLDVADPQLPGTVGQGGTVTSVTITAGTNLTGGGSVTTSGIITLNLSANPSVTTVDASTSYKVGGTKVIGAQGAAVADVASADATDLPTVITLANEIKAQVNTAFARLRAATGHGLWS